MAEKRFFDNLTAYSDGTGTPSEITAYKYDARGRLESVASPEGTIHYEYDYLGRHTRTYTGNQDTTGTPTASDGIAVTDTHYAYDSLGRLDTVTTVERFDTPLTTPEVTDYFYDLLGNLDETHSPNNVIADYQYDNLNRLELLRHFRDENDNDTYESGVDALLAEYDYTLAADGRRTAVTETDSSGNTTRIDWTYDNAGRLTRESYNSHNDSQDFITDYIFDLVGNRLSKKTDTNPTFLGDPTFDETVTNTHDANDRLLTETKDAPDTNDDRHTVYTYDNTQQTQKTVHQGLNDQGTKLSETTYAYNLQGRMATVTIDADGNGLSDTRLDYEYNDRGIRTSQTKTTDGNADGDFNDPEDTSTRTDYLVDNQNPTTYTQVLEEWLDGQLKTSYTLAHDVLTQAAITGAIHHLLYDGHGSTRMLVDALGLPLSSEIYRYDAYGNPIGFDPAQALTTLLYSGEQTDAATNLQYLRARYYDPSTGTFNRLDPFFGNLNDPQSLHKYLYTHNDPVNAVDPTGLYSLGNALASIGIMSIGLNLLVGVAHVAYYGSLAALAPDASLVGASVTLAAQPHQYVSVAAALSFALLTPQFLASLSGLGLAILEKTISYALTTETGLASIPFSMTAAAVGITAGIELVTTATDCRQAYFLYLGAAVQNSPGIAGEAYTGQIWGLPSIDGYKGPFVSLGIGLGFGAFGASTSFFFAPNNFSTHGTATGVTFGSVGSLAVSGTATWYFGPFYTDNLGYEDVSPYLLANAWPPGYNILLDAKARRNWLNRYRS